MLYVFSIGMPQNSTYKYMHGSALYTWHFSYTDVISVILMYHWIITLKEIIVTVEHADEHECGLPACTPIANFRLRINRLDSPHKSVARPLPPCCALLPPTKRTLCNAATNRHIIANKTLYHREMSLPCRNDVCNCYNHAALAQCFLAYLQNLMYTTKRGVTIIIILLSCLQLTNLHSRYR